MRKLNLGLPIAALLVFGMVFTACQKDNVLTEASKQNRFYNFQAGDNFTYSLESVCLGDEATVCFDNLQGSNCGNTQIQMWGPSDTDWNQVAGPTQPVNGVLCYTFTPTELGEYEFRGQWVRTGSPSSCPGVNTGWVVADPALQVVSCCEDTFTADLDCSADPKVLTVTFTAEEAGDYVIQGGLTNGTTIESMDADQGFVMNAGHPAVVNSNANVTRWEGSLDACETVTIIIEYTGGAGVGSWSAKSVVDGVEVTNGESDDQDCP